MHVRGTGVLKPPGVIGFYPLQITSVEQTSKRGSIVDMKACVEGKGAGKCGACCVKALK